MSPGTTLLIDDEKDDVFFMKRAVRDAGINCDLQVVGDGQSALDYLQGNGPYSDRVAYPLPELILLDLKMPLVSGLEVLQWLRQQPAFTKTIVIVLTGSREPVDHNRAYRFGANSTMEKPPTPEKLIDLVQAFGLWGHSREKTMGHSA
jgi:CheY-like chemotaxis protein